jgi:hypothetical protein
VSGCAHPFQAARQASAMLPPAWREDFPRGRPNGCQFLLFKLSPWRTGWALGGKPIQRLKSKRFRPCRPHNLSGGVVSWGFTPGFHILAFQPRTARSKVQRSKSTVADGEFCPTMNGMTCHPGLKAATRRRNPNWPGASQIAGGWGAVRLRSATQGDAGFSFPWAEAARLLSPSRSATNSPPPISVLS